MSRVLSFCKRKRRNLDFLEKGLDYHYNYYYNKNYCNYDNVVINKILYYYHVKRYYYLRNLAFTKYYHICNLSRVSIL